MGKAKKAKKKRLLEPLWQASNGEPIRLGDFVHTLHPSYTHAWFYKMPAVVKFRYDEPPTRPLIAEDVAEGKTVRVEFLGFGNPCHRTKSFQPSELTIIVDDQYLVYLNRLCKRVNRSKGDCT
jgi:hypothetical protein